jgi:hypothetical protein
LLFEGAATNLAEAGHRSQSRALASDLTKSAMAKPMSELA